MADMWEKLGSVTSLEPGVMEDQSSVMVESTQTPMQSSMLTPEQMLGTPEYRGTPKQGEQPWYKSIP